MGKAITNIATPQSKAWKWTILMSKYVGRRSWSNRVKRELSIGAFSADF
jgi:hypothetical protein